MRTASCFASEAKLSPLSSVSDFGHASKVKVYASVPNVDLPSDAVSNRIILPLSVTKTGIGA